MSKQYNLKNIRELLEAGFSATELRNFCYDTQDFQSVYNDLSESDSLRQIIDKLLRYAKRQHKIEVILKWVEENNKSQYEAHTPYFTETASPSPPLPSASTSEISLSRPKGSLAWALIAGGILLLLIGLYSTVSRPSLSPTATELNTSLAGIAPTEPVRSIGPTATTIPTAFSEVLSFADEFNFNGNDWPVGQYLDELGYSESQVIDGKYRIAVTAAKETGLGVPRTIPQIQPQNFRLSFDATLVETSNPDEKSADIGVSVRFRMQENGDYYLVRFGSNGVYRVELRQNEQTKLIKTSTSNNFIRLEQGLVNTFAIQVIASRMTIFANHQELASVTDTALRAAGKIELRIDVPTKQSATVDFDNLQITEFVPGNQLPETRTTATARPIAAATRAAGFTATARAQIAAITDAVVVFEDDFSSNRHGWAQNQDPDENGEDKDEDMDYVREISGGSYQMRVKVEQNKPGLRTWIPNLRVKDFLLSFEATVVEAPDNVGDVAVQIVFREQEDAYYYIGLGDSNQYAVWLRQGDWFKLQDWTYSDAFSLKPGVPNKFEILAVGSHFTIFANGQELTTLTNTILDEPGRVGIGLALDKAGDLSTVNFDNLVVKEIPLDKTKIEIETTATAVVMATATAQAKPTATAAAKATAIAQSVANARILFQDDFSSNTNNWQVGNFSDDFTDEEIQIIEGKYRRSILSKESVINRRPVPNFSIKDFWLSVEATILETSAPVGEAQVSLVFRDNAKGDYYVVGFRNNGTYRVSRRQSSGDPWESIFPDQGFAKSEAINLEVGTPNIFALLVKNSSFTIFANGQMLTKVSDPQLWEAGRIALATGLDKAGQTLTVDFDNLMIKEAP